MKFKYTEEILQDILERDHAVLISHDDKLSKRAIIHFICQCGKEEQKIAHELVRRAGAFCRECSVKKGIDKTKRTLKERYDKVPICTVESLHTTIQRDNAILLNEYTSVTINTIIHFRCNCNNESEKNCLQLISISGAFCEKCTRITWTRKIKETNIERYGVECTAQAPVVKEKIIQSNLENYGVECVLESKEIREKIKCTLIERYGVEHYTKTEECKDKMKKTNIERYGVDNPATLDEIKEKMKETILQRYGVDNYSKTDDWKEKTKETNMQRYGVDHYSKTEAYKEKIVKTNMQRYGVSNSNKTKETRDKIKATCLTRYGVEHPAQCQEIAEKTQKNAKKYKEYTMPSGTIRKVQGYEPFALDELVKKYQEDDIITDRKYIPRITYMINDKKKYYFPDIFIRSINTIIEVKSTWTYQSKLDNIREKESATKMAGYEYEIWVFDGKGNKI
jgi:hypothetical protein